MKDFDFNLLKVLHSLMLTHSVSRTAAEMKMTPGAISHALNRLREQFSDQILVRSGNKLVPTKLALQFIPVIEDTINQIEQLYSLGVKKPQERIRKDTVRIRCPDTIELALILPVHECISDNNIALEISSISEASQEELITELHQRKFDILLDIHPISDRSFISTHLAAIEQCLVCREGHPRLSGVISEEQLLMEHFVSNLSVKSLSYILQTPNVDVAYSTPYLMSRYNIVEKSDYIALSSAPIVKYFKEVFNLQALEYSLPIPPVNIYMTYHHSLKENETITFLLDAFRKHIIENRGDAFLMF